ncbi:MAG: BatA domain-containing protein, partial [bacterium]
MFGLSFLNSLFLWGTVAASIPLIIHLIKRNRAVKLPFAAVRFLQLKPSQKVKSQKLKQILLLLMRMMALALLAFAFARPFFKGADAGSIWGVQPKAAVILVDNSFSMGYDNLLRTATDKAKEVIASFNPGDQVAVMQFSEKAEIVAETKKDFSSLANQLNQLLTISNHSTNYMPAIQTAEAFLLDSPFESKEIYLISDFQKTGWSNVYPDWKIQPGIRLHFVNIGKKNMSNVTVKEVHLSEQSKTNRNINVLVRIKNYGSKKKKSVLTLHIQKRKVAQRNVTLLPEEEKIVQLHNVHFPKGLVSGFVEVQTEKEDLTTDNHYFFVVDSKTKAQILAVNGEPNPHDITKDELFFVDRAVNLPKLAKYILVQTVAEEIHDVDFHDYQAVILGNVKTSG